MSLDLLLKAGVDISRLERNTRRGLNTVWVVFDQHGERLVVSSTYEGDHMAGSLHYGDQAFDVFPPTSNLIEIFNDCASRLGPDWDIVTHKNYWHFEYDPK